MTHPLQLGAIARGVAPDPVHARAPWLGAVRVLGEGGSYELSGRELGRCTLMAEGSRLVPRDSSVTLELELDGERVQFAARVEAAVVVHGRALMMFRFGSTSPRGNDRLAAFARAQQLEVPLSPSIDAVTPAALHSRASRFAWPHRSVLPRGRRLRWPRPVIH